MVGVTSIETCNNVYNITPNNNIFQTLLDNDQVKHYGLFAQLEKTNEYLKKVYNLKNVNDLEIFK